MRVKDDIRKLKTGKLNFENEIKGWQSQRNFEMTRDIKELDNDNEVWKWYNEILKVYGNNLTGNGNDVTGNGN